MPEGVFQACRANPDPLYQSCTCPEFVSCCLSLITFLYNYTCTLSRFSRVRLFATLQTVAHLAPLSMGFSRQEYWNGLPFPPAGDLPNLGIKPTSLVSPALTGKFFTTSDTWEALILTKKVKVKVIQSCPTLCDPMDYTVHEILQARTLAWVTFSFSRGSSQPRD